MENKKPPQKFCFGDIVRIVDPVLSDTKLSRVETPSGPKLMKTNMIEGLAGHIPYAKTLVRKKFFYVPGSTTDTGYAPYGSELVLYENYKPGILGRGYPLPLRVPSTLKLELVSRVIDLRNLPPRLTQRLLSDEKSRTISVESQYITHGMSNLALMAHKRTLRILPFHKDPAYNEAIKLLSGHKCPNCGHSIMSVDTRIKPLTDNDRRVLTMSVSCSSEGHVPPLFPMKYRCGDCGTAIFMVKFNPPVRRKGTVTVEPDDGGETEVSNFIPFVTSLAEPF